MLTFSPPFSLLLLLGSVSVSADVITNLMHDVVDRLHASSHPPSHSTGRQPHCDFSLRAVCESAVKTMVQALSLRIEAASFIDPRVSWVMHGSGDWPSGIKRVILNLGEYYHAACKDLYALLLTLDQEAPRAPTEAELARLPPREDGSETVEMVDVTFTMRALNAQGLPAQVSSSAREVDMPLWLADYETDRSLDGVSTGFRLWLARKLIVSCFGTTESAEDFATCRFRIAFQRPAHPLPATKTEPTPIFNAEDCIVVPRVLIVESCGPLREALTRYIEAWHFETEGCANLSEARKKVSEDTDLSMVLINLHHNVSDYEAKPRSSEERGHKDKETARGDERAQVPLPVIPAPVVPEVETNSSRRTSFNAAPGSTAHGGPGSPTRCSSQPGTQPRMRSSSAHPSFLASSYASTRVSHNGSVDGAAHGLSELDESYAGSEASGSGSGGAVGLGVVGKGHPPGVVQGHGNTNGFRDGGTTTQAEMPEYLQVLEMKKKKVFMGLPVIAISPFQLQRYSFYGPKGRNLSSTGWQVITKPVISQRLLSALTDALSDEPTDAPETQSGISAAHHANLLTLAAHPFPHLHPIRVLVVDDQPVKHNLIRWILESQGMQCDMAMDGFECVRAVEESDYDIILMDVNMPGMNGLDATEQIRIYERTAESGTMHIHVPIIGMSCQARGVGMAYFNEHSDGFSDIESDIGIPEMDDYLNYPLQQDDLLEKVRKWAEWARSVQTLPVIGVHLLSDVSGGDPQLMVNMVDEFVRTAFLQVGSLRNAFITNEGQMLLSGCEVIRSSSRRFGAVWLVRAASYLMWLLSLSQLPSSQANTRIKPDMDRTVAALRRCEEEIVLIGKFAEQLRAGIRCPTESLASACAHEELTHISETQEVYWAGGLKSSSSSPSLDPAGTPSFLAGGDTLDALERLDGLHGLEDLVLDEEAQKRREALQAAPWRDVDAVEAHRVGVRVLNEIAQQQEEEREELEMRDAE